MSSNPKVLWVQNLPASWTEADLKRVFETFGKIDLVERPRNSDGTAKPFGFVHFETEAQARAAMGSHNTLEVEGQTLYLRHKLAGGSHRPPIDPGYPPARHRLDEPHRSRDDRSHRYEHSRDYYEDERHYRDSYRHSDDRRYDPGPPPRRRDDYYGSSRERERPRVREPSPPTRDIPRRSNRSRYSPDRDPR